MTWRGWQHSALGAACPRSDTTAAPAENPYRSPHGSEQGRGRAQRDTPAVPESGCRFLPPERSPDDVDQGIRARTDHRVERVFGPDVVFRAEMDRSRLGRTSSRIRAVLGGDMVSVVEWLTAGGDPDRAARSIGSPDELVWVKCCLQLDGIWYASSVLPYGRCVDGHRQDPLRSNLSTTCKLQRTSIRIRRRRIDTGRMMTVRSSRRPDQEHECRRSR